MNPAFFTHFHHDLLDGFIIHLLLVFIHFHHFFSMNLAIFIHCHPFSMGFHLGMGQNPGT